MTRKIYGTITDIDNGTPLKGLRVEAWDADWPEGDDFMGRDITNANGQYEISYHDGYWDQSILGLPTWYPDIYITVEMRNSTDKWVRLINSQVYKDYRLSENLNIDLSVRVEPEITKMTSFDPIEDGFHFKNNFDIKMSILNLDIEQKGMGLCGGMCAAALNRFTNHLDITKDDQIPTQGTTLYDELLKRQLETIPPVTLANMYAFQGAPDQVDMLRKASIGQLTKKEWPKLKAELDKGNPTILVLVRAKGVFDNPSKNHQVLAIGYDFNPTTKDLKIFEYDPNKPKEIHTLLMSLALPDGKLYLRDTAKRGTRGFMVNDAGMGASD
jgi:hypothetical protein